MTMLKSLCLCAAGVFVIAASFIPAPDLDAPKVYYKACVYCQDCTPQCEWMNDSYRWWSDSLGHAHMRFDTTYIEFDCGLNPVDVVSCYRCQRTGKRMTFDSVGVVVWGKYYDIRCASIVVDIIPPFQPCDTTVIADTSGIVRIQ